MERDALNELESSYQILTELQGDGGSRTYLARHRELNRDVSITVYKATDTFVADAERLKSLKHANVTPVIEARRLSDGTVAVVRPRVRGTTLDQLLSAVGAMPQSRIDTAMNDIQSALAWARTNSIVNRYVSPDSLVFQQGNGRVLLSFEPSEQPVDDQRTMRELGAAMHGGTAQAATMPQDNAAVVVMQRKGMSFGARVFTAFAVIAAVVLAVVFWAKSHEKPARTTAGVVVDSSVSGGETVRSAPIDTTIYPTPRIIEPNQPVNPVQGQPMPGQPMPGQPMPAQPMPVQPMPVQPMPQPMPARPTPVPAQPEPQPTRPVSPPVDTTVVSRPPTLDVCDSPTPEDQRHCLSTAVDKADQQLNSVYQKLIAALRRQAAAGDTAADPSSVEELRASQRRWLEERDSVCRGTGSGMLYARDRAACYADRASSRTRELQAQLDAIP